MAKGKELNPEHPEPESGLPKGGLFKPHPNLGDAVNENIIESNLSGGIRIDELKVGRMLEIETQNRFYTLEHRPDGYYISGHPKYCPEPVKVSIHGSTWGGSMLKVGFVGRNMRLEFSDPKNSEHGVVTTSPIKEIKEFPIKPDSKPKT